MSTSLTEQENAVLRKMHRRTDDPFKDKFLPLVGDVVACVMLQNAGVLVRHEGGLFTIADIDKARARLSQVLGVIDEDEALALRVENVITRLDSRLRDSERWRDAVHVWRVCVREVGPGSVPTVAALFDVLDAAGASLVYSSCSIAAVLHAPETLRSVVEALENVR